MFRIYDRDAHWCATTNNPRLALLLLIYVGSGATVQTRDRNLLLDHGEARDLGVLQHEHAFNALAIELSKRNDEYERRLIVVAREMRNGKEHAK